MGRRRRPRRGDRAPGGGDSDRRVRVRADHGRRRRLPHALRRLLAGRRGRLPAARDPAHRRRGDDRPSGAPGLRWGHQRFPIVPDILYGGKGLGGELFKSRSAWSPRPTRSSPTWHGSGFMFFTFTGSDAMCAGAASCAGRPRRPAPRRAQPRRWATSWPLGLADAPRRSSRRRRAPWPRAVPRRRADARSSRWPAVRRAECLAHDMSVYPGRLGASNTCPARLLRPLESLLRRAAPRLAGGGARPGPGLPGRHLPRSRRALRRRHPREHRVGRRRARRHRPALGRRRRRRRRPAPGRPRRRGAPGGRDRPGERAADGAGPRRRGDVAERRGAAASMAPLLAAHAAELHDGSWSSDVERLVRTSGLGPTAPTPRAAVEAAMGGGRARRRRAGGHRRRRVLAPRPRPRRRPAGRRRHRRDRRHRRHDRRRHDHATAPPPDDHDRRHGRLPERADRRAPAGPRRRLRHRAGHRVRGGRLVPRAGRRRPPADQRRPHRHRPQRRRPLPRTRQLQRQGRRLPAARGFVLLPRVAGIARSSACRTRCSSS